jgi:hypothetical protein
VASVVVCDSVDDRYGMKFDTHFDAISLYSFDAIYVTLSSMSSASCPHSLAFLFPGDAGVDAGGGPAYGRSET